MRESIDLNCDLGEIPGDEALLALVTSANIACGFHAGDPIRMQQVIAACIGHRVAIGAHPSYFDRDGFGRSDQAIDPDGIHALVLYQVGAMAAMVRAAGGVLQHVKPHGALYNRAAVDRAAADAVAAAVAAVDRRLRLIGLAGSALVDAGLAAGLAVGHEAFVERRYEADGRLSPRALPGAVIDSIDDAIAQMRDLLHRNNVIARNGERVTVVADTLCLHGDRTDAVAFATALRMALQQDGIAMRALPPVHSTERQ